MIFSLMPGFLRRHFGFTDIRFLRFSFEIFSSSFQFSIFFAIDGFIFFRLLSSLPACMPGWFSFLLLSVFSASSPRLAGFGRQAIRPDEFHFFDYVDVSFSTALSFSPPACRRFAEAFSFSRAAAAAAHGLHFRLRFRQRHTLLRYRLLPGSAFAGCRAAFFTPVFGQHYWQIFTRSRLSFGCPSAIFAFSFSPPSLPASRCCIDY
jgi:hypothetical protein